jgi:hypothetical protein
MAQHVTGTEQALLVAGIAATATVVVTLLGAFLTYRSSRRERRRALYSDAIKAAVGWKEMLYRVRRRRRGQGDELIRAFHELQDQLTYYEALIGTESKYMKRSYDRLVKAVKTATQPLITQAWSDNLRPIPGNAVAGDTHPDLSDPVDMFLLDVRSHLAPGLVRKLAVWWRNREAE